MDESSDAANIVRALQAWSIDALEHLEAIREKARAHGAPHEPPTNDWSYWNHVALRRTIVTLREALDGLTTDMKSP
ncbi:hypothetical protein [Candidatus Poriferisodalis multihospitum]|uniref:hypothetical protein n=1 Tax=Candidatus Poriferisodalis multihospitum TaxID=2983191 RepID=UPI002B25EB21|nr:hypothetical protein [Candidatus Poriferisodalis multihospitum]